MATRSDGPFGPTLVETTLGYETAKQYRGLRVATFAGSFGDLLTYEPRVSVLQVLLALGLHPGEGDQDRDGCGRLIPPSVTVTFTAPQYDVLQRSSGPEFGHLPLKAILRSTVQGWVARQVTDGVYPGTIVARVKALQTVLAARMGASAMQDGLDSSCARLRPGDGTTQRASSEQAGVPPGSRERLAATHW